MPTAMSMPAAVGLSALAGFELADCAEPILFLVRVRFQRCHLDIINFPHILYRCCIVVPLCDRLSRWAQTHF